MTISESQDVDGVEQLTRNLAGRIATSADVDWDTVRAAWNLSVDQRPDLVAIPENADDVSTVVNFARRHGMCVAPQGTGHGASVIGDLSNTILLRTDRLRKIDVDPKSGNVRVDAGVLWSEVTSALAPFGLAGLAGSSGSVGVVGFSIGGGYSWLARRYGLAVSSITAAELVTGDGAFHRVDVDHEAELFWALRGSGGNVGIVTALEFKPVTLANVYAGALLFPIERAGEVLTAYEHWTRELDESATTCARLLRIPPMPELPDLLRGKSFVGIDGAIAAPAIEAEALLWPLRALGPVMDNFVEMPVAALGQIHMDPPEPAPGRTDGLILDDLPADAIAELLKVAGPGVDSPLLAIDLRHLGGAISRPDAGGAVGHLPGRFLLNGVGITPTPEAMQLVDTHIGRLHDAMAPWTNSQDYMNFREVSVPATRFYSAETLERLLEIQTTHDPDRVIRSEHQLAPAMA